MNETPFFFDGNGYRLFGVLHEALGPAKKEGFVFCAPFAEEKLWTHRVFVSFARLLAEKGYPVLRFDYMGNGDSEGDFEECSVKTMVADIHCAIRTLLQRVLELESVGLLGLRFGATLALLTAGDENDVNKLILWEPVFDGSAYMKEMLRINLATQTSVYKEIRHPTDALIKAMREGKTANVDGYDMSWPLYGQSVEITLPGKKMSFCGPVLVVGINRRQQQANKSFAALAGSMPNCYLEQVVEEPFWKEIKQYYGKAASLFDVTIKWLQMKR